MASSNSPEPSPRTASDDPVADALAPETEVIDEPLTPQEVLAWNGYYDRYVAGGVLLLILLVSLHKITAVASPIWPMLRTGELIAREGRLITTDRYSFTEANKPWVNVPWIYEVASHFLHSNAKAMFTNDEAMASQIGAGVLVFLNAIARVFAVVLLLRLTRPGPGLWWFALVATFAFGCVPAPNREAFEWSVGGIARQAIVAPETWGNLLLVTQILILDRALVLRRAKALYALPPLFLLWANLDQTFAFGLLILVIGALAAIVGKRGNIKTEEAGASPGLIAAIVAGCFAVCLANPSGYRIFGAAFGPYLSIPSMVFSSGNHLQLVDHLSFFGKDSWQAWGSSVVPRLRLVYYIVIVLAGLATFFLDMRRINIFRLAIYVLAALLWGGLNRLSAEFAVVFTYAVGLNGQEWYHARYGTEGRLGGNWTAWSIGGRAVTIVLLFLVMYKTLTGTNYAVGRPTFGFGYDPADFDFEAADYLKSSKVAGQIMNLSDATGDAIIARAYPTRKTFIDRRSALFGPEIRQDIATFRSAFTSQEVAAPDVVGLPESETPSGDSGFVELKEDTTKWRPIMDKYNATAVLFNWENDFKMYGAMLSSKNWILLYDNGHSVMFGRADAPAEDLAVFDSQRLDANEIVYKRKDRIPFPDRAPAPMTFIDNIIRNRTLGKPQPHFLAGQHWLTAGATIENGGRPDAAHAIMAIREARKAIAANPDESDAYRLLDFAYDKLSLNEFGVFAAKKQNVPMGFFSYRARQRVTALNYAIQTTPPPRTAETRAALADSYMRLAGIYQSTSDYDMERDCLAAARDLYPEGTFAPADSKRLDTLDDAIRTFKDRLDRAAGERGMDDPVNKADLARSNGFTGMAIQFLEEAENQGIPVDRYLNMMVNLYCRTGQPEKANEKLSSRQADDPALFNGPGTPAYTHGLVNLLLGFYENAKDYWERGALSQAEFYERQHALGFAKEILGGAPDRAIDTVLNLTGQPGKPGEIEIEASWEFELALALLEFGEPAEAGRHFVRALQFNPKISVRPLIEDYLKKLDIAIPPDPDAAPEEKPAAADEKPAADAAKPDPPKADETKSDAPKPDDKKPDAAKPDDKKPDAPM